MPRVAENVFAQFYDSAIKLASRETGVSRPELMKRLNISRVIADKVIEKAGLEPSAKVGRTEFFKLPEGAQAAAVVVNNAAPANPGKGRKSKAAAAATPVTVPPAPTPTQPAQTDAVGEEIQNLDKQIVEIKRLIEADCADIAKAQARLAGHQALLTALLTQHITTS